MRAAHKSKWIGLAFLALLASFPVFVGVYFADPANNVFFRAEREAAAWQAGKKESRVFQGKVFLLRDSSVVVNKTRLVYKGLDDRHILLEYYLLELDPKTPYQNQMTYEKARDGIRIGDCVFQLVSAGRNVLQLEVDHFYTTD